MRQAPQDLKNLSILLDSKFGIGKFRFGWDGIIGLVPVIGDLVTSGASLYIVFRAAALGCPPSVLLRMGCNILIDDLLDVIPVLGHVFDFVWKSNNKNIVLLERYLNDPRQTTRSSRVMIFFTLLFMFAIFCAVLFGLFLITKWLFSTVPALIQEQGWDA
jgi:hypothetical protein